MPTISLALTDAQVEALEQYAQAHGLTLAQAATQAAQQQLQARFVTHKRFNNIARLPR
jgi:hypothetical protein